MRFSQQLREIYHLLLSHFGPQKWWPAETPFEVCVGAILTQNTSWTNVEKAIVNLKQAGVLNFEKLRATPDDTIAELIKPAGYFRLKTKRLRNFLNFVHDELGTFEALADLSTQSLREKLLSVSGIGAETADAMTLYAFHKPIFVVDAYTKRILVRHRLLDEEADYARLQELFHDHLEEDATFFNEYHALIVMTGKTFCQKANPDCEHCPLKNVNGGPILYY